MEDDEVLAALKRTAEAAIEAYRAEQRKLHNQWQRDRRARDPEYRARRNIQARTRDRERWAAEPEYREHWRAYRTEYLREWRRKQMQDPAYRDRVNAQRRERRAKAKREAAQ